MQRLKQNNSVSPLIRTCRLLLAIACLLVSSWMACVAGSLISAGGLTYSGLIIIQLGISLLYVSFMHVQRRVRPHEPGTQLQDVLVLIAGRLGSGGAGARQAKRRLVDAMTRRLIVAGCFWLIAAALVHAMGELGATMALGYPHYLVAMLLLIIAALVLEPMVAAVMGRCRAYCRRGQ